jgi:large subunit ribosomal protein L33
LCGKFFESRLRSDVFSRTAFLTIAACRLACAQRRNPEVRIFEVQMAKTTTIKVKLVSSADTGFYYVTRKNSRTMTDKLVKKKYDPVAKKHVEFRESKIK